MIKVLIVDDQDLVRVGLRTLIEDAEDLEIVGEADTGMSALASARETKPDVVLMDIRMPGMNGLEATRRHPPRRGFGVGFQTCRDHDGGRSRGSERRRASP